MTKPFTLLRRKECWCLTPCGVFVLLAGLALASAFLLTRLYAFLAIDAPEQGEALVFEGWVPDHVLEDLLLVAEEGDYRWIIATGGPVPWAAGLLPGDTFADVTYQRLLHAGFPAGKLISVPAPPVRRDRTVAAAQAVSDYLREAHPDLRGLDVYTLETHARRSLMAYRRACAWIPSVGVHARPALEYDRSDWWRSSDGVKGVLSETLSLLYHLAAPPYPPSLWRGILALLLAYLLGSIPFGLLASRCKGLDIRTMGSGNIGATNVFRSMGKSWGLAVFILDFSKGFIPAFLFPLWILAGAGPAPRIVGLLLGCAALAGHNWPVFLRFRGGKGVATSAGMLAGSVPMAMLAGIAAWLVLMVSTRFVSVSSMGAAIVAGGSALILYPGQLTVSLLLCGVAVVIVWQHRSNIRRLYAGSEHRFSFRKRRKSP